MWTVAFWRDAAERALKTAGQVLATVLIADGTGLMDTNWGAAFSVAGMAMVLSVLTSLSSELVSPNGTASLLTVDPPTTRATE